MKTGCMTHLAMSVNGSPLGLWVPHSVQEAQAFDVAYSDTPLSMVSESSFLGHGSSQYCFQRQVFGHHWSGARPTASCNSALLEHHCLALIAFCMVGLRHEMEVNTQMYLKRQTRTTYTMADEKVY